MSTVTKTTELERSTLSLAHEVILHRNTSQIGVDVVEIDRFARQLNTVGERLATRWFTLAEREFCAGEPDRLAVTLAGKEAVAKVLRTGFRGGVRWTQIEILRESAGAPYVKLHGDAAQRASLMAIERIAISLCHEGPYAVAVAAGLQRAGSQ
jgi:holo-[acyl-carrier protein] synthase